MHLEAWIGAHVAAFHPVGGFLRIAVPVNALTATYRKAKGDAARFVNDRHLQMTDYCGTAVVLVGVKETPWQCGCGIGGEHAHQACDRDLAEETWPRLDRVQILKHSHPISSGLHRKSPCS